MHETFKVEFLFDCNCEIYGWTARVIYEQLLHSAIHTTAPTLFWYFYGKLSEIENYRKFVWYFIEDKYRLAS